MESNDAYLYDEDWDWYKTPPEEPDDWEIDMYENPLEYCYIKDKYDQQPTDSDFDDRASFIVEFEKQFVASEEQKDFEVEIEKGNIRFVDHQLEEIIKFLGFADFAIVEKEVVELNERECILNIDVFVNDMGGMIWQIRYEVNYEDNESNITNRNTSKPQPGDPDYIEDDINPFYDSTEIS